MKKEVIAKIVTLGVVALSLVRVSAQEQSGLVPDRLGIGNASSEDGVSLTSKGEILPGDRGSNLPEDVSPETAAERERDKIMNSLPESVRRLSNAKQYEITRLLAEASMFIQGIRLQEGLDRLIQIEAITDELYLSYNLRGAIHTKLRSFDKARVAFQRSLELNSNAIEARFNLAELDFVEKKFPEAEAAFRQLQIDFADYFANNTETARLVDYKLFISVLMQSEAPGDSKETQALAMFDTEAFDYLDDYPVYYYSQAALSFFRENDEEAEEWTASAAKIYSKPVQTIYVDALVEMGWVDAL